MVPISFSLPVKFAPHIARTLPISNCDNRKEIANVCVVPDPSGAGVLPSVVYLIWNSHALVLAISGVILIRLISYHLPLTTSTSVEISLAADVVATAGYPEYHAITPFGKVLSVVPKSLPLSVIVGIHRLPRIPTLSNSAAPLVAMRQPDTPGL